MFVKIRKKYKILAIFKRREFLLLVFILLVTVSLIGCYRSVIQLLIQVVIQVYRWTHPNPFKCYKNPENLLTLPNIETRNITPGKNIVFLETFCTSREKGKIYLFPRQACAVESAALRNPNLEVHVMFTAPATVKYSNATEDKILQALLSYKNIFLSRIDLDSYFAGTPVEELYKSGLMEISAYPRIHMSDVLRWLTLWKYGSIYLDLDVITLRTFEDMEPNFAGFENLSTGFVGSAVLSFGATGSGHLWTEMILDNLNKHYSPKEWSTNSNEQLARFLRRLCNDTQYEVSYDDCQGFTMYEPDVFYPWSILRGLNYIYSKEIATMLSRLQKSRTVHTWNNRHKNHLMKKGEKSAFEIVFMINCPRVYAQLPARMRF